MRDSVNLVNNPASPQKDEKKKKVLLMKKAFVDKKGKLIGEEWKNEKEGLESYYSRRSIDFLGN